MNNVIFGNRVINLDKLVVTKNTISKKAKFVNYKPFNNELVKIKIRRSRRGR